MMYRAPSDVESALTAIAFRLAMAFRLKLSDAIVFSFSHEASPRRATDAAMQLSLVNVFIFLRVKDLLIFINC
jgi:hypothetical protein